MTREINLTHEFLKRELRANKQKVSDNFKKNQRLAKSLGLEYRKNVLDKYVRQLTGRKNLLVGTEKTARNVLGKTGHILSPKRARKTKTDGLSRHDFAVETMNILQEVFEYVGESWIHYYKSSRRETQNLILSVLAQGEDIRYNKPDDFKGVSSYLIEDTWYHDNDSGAIDWEQLTKQHLSSHAILRGGST